MPKEIHDLLLFFAPFPLLAGVLILLLLAATHWRRRRCLAELACFVAFGAYLLMVVNVTLFPIPLPEVLPGFSTRASWATILSRVNLIPFDYGRVLNARVLLYEILDNLLMTIPFGFGLNFVTHVRARDFAWLAPVLGFTIEASQLAVSLAIGGIYRSVDVNDVILNAAGVLIGYGLFRLLARGYLNLGKPAAVEPAGLGTYLLEVANRAAS